jgi:hypothetical protein
MKDLQNLHGDTVSRCQFHDRIINSAIFADDSNTINYSKVKLKQAEMEINIINLLLAHAAMVEADEQILQQCCSSGSDHGQQSAQSTMVDMEESLHFKNDKQT